MIVAANVRQVRDELGLTQRELAARVNGVDSLAVSRWERGHSVPALENLLALCRESGRDAAWFYTDHSEEAAA